MSESNWELNSASNARLPALGGDARALRRHLYNAENCCAWKHPGSFQEELPRLKRPPKGDRLGRPSIMIYTPEGKVGAFQVNEYTGLIRKAFKAKVRQGLGRGQSIEDILRDL